ncbi:MAG: VOC family protein [Gemmatimonadetes bacterium]|nr:VOC family protein [Gemmatimonadota bacterium]
MKPSRILVFLLAACSSSQPAVGQNPPVLFESSGFFALQVADAEEMAGWYGRVLGLEMLRVIDDEDRGMRIRILSDGVVGVELIEAPGWEVPPQRHRGIFKAGLFVRDIEGAYEWIHDQGVESDARIVTDEVMQVRTFVLQDPEGNRVQLFEKCRPAC